MIILLTHYLCATVRVLPEMAGGGAEPNLDIPHNMQLYIPMGICMLMFRYCRINCYHQPQPGRCCGAAAGLFLLTKTSTILTDPRFLQCSDAMQF